MNNMQDLRTYLDKLEKTLPSQLIRLNEQVDWRYEVTSRVIKAERSAKNPSLLFERIKGYKMPMLINVFGSIDRIQLALGANKFLGGGRLAFYEDWNTLFSSDMKPVHVDSGPVKDIIIRGSNLDLLSLPIPKFYEQDGGRYITAGLMTARNPENPDEVNLSFVRMQVKSRDTLGVSLHSRGHMWQYYDVSKASGNPLEVAVIIGAHPSLYLTAAAKITDEYSKAGALIGEPIKLVGCKTVDVPVPSHAEVVLEGQVTLEDEEEGPFTEYTGYISGRSTHNQLKLSAISMRHDAIFQSVAPSNSAEHLLLSGLPKQARISKALIDFTHTNLLKDIIWPVWGTHFVCFLSLRSEAQMPGVAKQVALLLMGLDHYVKIAVVLPESVDVSDTSQVLSMIAQRCDFIKGSGIEILGKVYSHMLDPSSPIGGLSSKMIIDATGPIISSIKKSKIVNPLTSQILITFLNGSDQVCVVSGKTSTLATEHILDQTKLNQCSLAVIVDEDIDVNDARQVLWAMATRFQPEDRTMLEEGRMIIDARKGADWIATTATIPEEKESH
jgi:2,5-furandicarboxylate decarboxylase 1